MRSLTFCLFVSAAFLEIATAQQATDTSVISLLNQKLLAKQKSANPYETTPTVTPPTTPVHVERKTFSEQISFLSDGQMTVMIPKGAMLHLPPKNRISIQEKIKGKLVEWDEFFLANRNAIRLEPVDLDQMQGGAPLSPKSLEQISKANLPTLATYQNRVISLPAPPQKSSAPTVTDAP